MAAPRSLVLGCCLLASALAAGCGVPASSLKTKRSAVVARANQICTRSTARAQRFVAGMRRPTGARALGAVVNQDGAITQDAVTALEYLQPTDARRRSFEAFLVAETAVQDEGINLVGAVRRRRASALARSERTVVRETGRAAVAARAYGLRPCPWILPSALVVRRAARGGRPDAMLAVWERAARRLPANPG
jgi:hypothetical protein